MPERVHRWAELTREQIRELAPACVTVLPVASIEQHGPHLPTVTDTALVDAVLDRACEAVELATVLRAPTLQYGSSDHHLPFGGTLSLTSGTFTAVLGDLLRSLATAGCRRIFVVNGHGGNDAICKSVAADAARELGLIVATASYWQLVPPEAMPFPGHAGEFETSLMLAAAERLVRLDLARPSPGSREPLPEGVQLDEPDAWQRIDGFTDDPRQASRGFGLAELDRCGLALAAAIDTLAERKEHA